MKGKARTDLLIEQRVKLEHLTKSEMSLFKRCATTMSPLPPSLSIALWMVGSFWMISLLIWITGGPSELIGALTVLGIAAGIYEWICSRNRN